MASNGQKIKLLSLLKITSAVSAHDLAIGEGAVDITVGFTDVRNQQETVKLLRATARLNVRAF